MRKLLQKGKLYSSKLFLSFAVLLNSGGEVCVSLIHTVKITVKDELLMQIISRSAQYEFHRDGV